MSLLDAIYAICLSWFTGGKSKYKTREFKDWMPGDWVDSHQAPKKRVSIVKQLDAFARATMRK